MTYPNDSNFFYMVLETLRLLAGIFLDHDVDERMVAEIWERIVVVLGESVRRKSVHWAGEKAVQSRKGPKVRREDETFGKHLFILPYTVMCSAIG